MPEFDLDRLILKIHAAPLDPGAWPTAVASIKEWLGAQAGLMLRVSLQPHVKPWLVPVDFAPEALAVYGEHWAAEDPWYRGAVARGRIRAGVVSLDDHLVERRELRRTAFFNEYLEKYGLDRFLNVVSQSPDPGLGVGPTAVSFLRATGQPGFGTEEAQRLERLAPHLALATRNAYTAAGFHQLGALQMKALDAVSIPVFAVRESGALLFANRRAEQALRAERWIRIHNGVVCGSGDCGSRQAVASVLAELRKGLSASVVLTDAVGGRAAVTGAPLSEPAKPAFPSVGAVGLIWLVPMSSTAAPAGQFGYLFQLTAAELRLLELLMNGTELREVAAMLRISVHTARNQLKSIFRKTGSRTQGQLLGLAHRLTLMQVRETDSSS